MCLRRLQDLRGEVDEASGMRLLRVVWNICYVRIVKKGQQECWPRINSAAQDQSVSKLSILRVLHAVSRHLQRDNVDRGLIGRNVGFQCDMVPFVTFNSIRVADGIALAVAVAHERLAVIADFTGDV